MNGADTIVTAFFLLGGFCLIVVGIEMWSNEGDWWLLLKEDWEMHVTMLLDFLVFLAYMYFIAILDMLISRKFDQQAQTVDTALASCKRLREHTPSSHGRKAKELEKAIALLDAVQAEIKLNRPRRSAASIFLQVQKVGIVLTAVSSFIKVQSAISAS